MKFSTTAGALKDALHTVRGVIPTSPSLLAYSGVHIAVDSDGVVKVTGSDGETSLVVTLRTGTSSSGSVLLQPKPLSTFLATLPASTPLLVESDGQSDVTFAPNGFSEYQFRPLAATFPPPPAASGKPKPCDLDGLSAALASIRSAIPRDTQAIQLVSTDTRLVLNTTDTFRLVRAAIPSGFGDFTGVVSAQVLDKVARMEPTSVTVDTRGRIISFTSSDMAMTARLLAVPFPAVDSVIDSKPPFSVTFDPRALRSAAARLAAVADQAPIKIRLEGSEMKLEASTADIGAGAEVVQLNAPVAAPFEVLVKAQYLQDVVAAMDTSTAALAYSGALNPLYLSADDPIEQLHVVMPVRG